MIRMCKAIDAGTIWGNTYRTYSFMVPLGGGNALAWGANLASRACTSSLRPNPS